VKAWRRRREAKGREDAAEEGEGSMKRARSGGPIVQWPGEEGGDHGRTQACKQPQRLGRTGGERQRMPVTQDCPEDPSGVAVHLFTAYFPLVGSFS
jgi:hypothetical protein